ncbi:MAG: hypothetical protein LH468_06105 [Nocardioides sp.]|nr:hypothetical protein [Nocardioides sp.]
MTIHPPPTRAQAVGRPAADPVGELFASRSVAVHVVRGVVGLLLVVGGLALTTWSAWSLLLVPPGVLAWRGCPTCWTMGLIATLARGRSSR